jgi:VCBS repeat-containing protein
MATQIGIVKALIGTVTATAADGSIRNLQVGDRVFVDELISTGTAGAIEIEFADGNVMDLGRDSQALLDNAMYNTEAVAADSDADADAIQAAILAGADPTQITDATAAGAGTQADGNEGHAPVVIDYLAPQVTPESGFDTTGISVAFPEIIEELQAPIEEVSLVSVSVGVDVEIGTPTPGDEQDDVILIPPGTVIPVGVSAVNIPEGTSDGGSHPVTFLITLSQVSTQPVSMHYQVIAGSASNPDDFFDGNLEGDVIIPAGYLGFTVTVNINEDHLDEGDESFYIQLSDVVGATLINGTATVTIIDDDTTPVAQDDFNAVTEDGGEGLPQTMGNVISGANDAANDPAAQQDTDQDGDVLQIVSFSDADETSAPGGTITGEYGELTMNPDGSYTYVLTSNEDPDIQGLSEGETLTDTFSYIVTDTYNAQQTANLTIVINGADDGVTLTGLNGEGAEEYVYEANLSDGSDTDIPALTQGGDFSFVALDGLAILSIGGQDFNLAALNALDGTQEITTPYGTLTLLGFSGDSFGGTVSYQYTLNDNVDNDSQANASDFNYTDSFAVIVTDEDGSTTNDTLDITIVDDVPTAVDDGVVNVGEDTPVDINVFANDVAGADGVDLATDIALTTDGANGSAVYNGDGTFTYTPNANAPAGPDSFTYTITDADGDTSTATVTLNLLADSTPLVGTITNLEVDEDGFAYAADDTVTTRDDETDSTESLTDTTGTVTVDFGNDVPANLLASIVLVDEGALDAQLQSDGQDVDFALDIDGDLVGTVDGGATEVIRIEITGAALGTNTGEVDYTYSVTLSQPLDHPDASLENSDLLSGVKFTVTDSDGSTANGTFDVTVVDDVPAMTVSGTDTVAEDAVGTIGGTWDNASAGADGAASTVVKVGASTYALGADIALAEGTLNVAVDGTWTFDPNTGLDQDNAQSVTFSVEVTDGDGDVASDPHTITITDGAGPGDASPINLSVDEDDLPLGSDGSDSLTDSDTLTFTLGSDALASMAFVNNLTGLALNTDGIAGDDVIWSYDSATQITGTVGGQLAITLTLTPNLIAGTASVSAVLSDNFLHTNGDDIQTNLDLGSVSVIATDIDGDTATGTVNVAVVDDVPAMTVSGTDTVAEDAVGTIGGTWDNASAGADGAASTVVKVGASTYALGADIALAEGTLNVAVDGTWTFDPNTGLDQDNAQSVTFSVEVTDGDGDVASDPHTITITDGAGPGDASPINLSVDEDDLPLGSDGSDSLTDSDTLTFTLGSDALASMAFVNNLTGLALNTDGIAGDDVIWSYDSATQITGTVGGQLAITLTLTPNLIAGTASVSAVLSDNFLHTNGDDIQTNLDLGSVSVIATDIDGDTATGTVNVAVVDDVPIVGIADDSSTSNVAGFVASGDLHFSAGADGLGGFIFIGTPGPATLGDGTPMKSNGAVVSLSGFGTNILTASAEIGGETVTIFTATLNVDGTYDIAMQGSLDSTATFNVLNLGDLGISGGNGGLFVVGSGTLGTAEDDILITPTKEDGTINTSATDIGTGNQWIDDTLGVRFDFVSGIQADGTYTGGARTLTGASIKLATVKGGDSSTNTFIALYDAFGDSLFTEADALDGNISIDSLISTLTYTSGGNIVNVDLSTVVVTSFTDVDGDIAYGFSVPSVDENTSINLTTTTGFSSLEIYNEAGPDFSINGIGGAYLTTEPVDFDLTYAGVDGDGDISGEDTFNVTLNPYVEGTAGDDYLVGGSGDDILIGGAGDDILTGGAGADEFVWNFGDTGTDTITDFNAGEGDVLNLADLLDPDTTLDIGGANSLDDYLKANFDIGTNTTTIDVYTGGDANAAGTIAQSIVINGDLTDLNTLLTNNNLLVDQ